MVIWNIQNRIKQETRKLFMIFGVYISRTKTVLIVCKAAQHLPASFFLSLG